MTVQGVFIPASDVGNDCSSFIGLHARKHLCMLGLAGQ